ncbi:MAG: pyridoxal-phosphate dependent enzyme, partial [Candidatus Melainabacteria bacterium]|nr:pyridoxal-phosphate dependent enzyme [Candidatus Melainabacteria bacterium]
MVDNKISLNDVLVARKKIAGKAINTPFRKSHWLSELTGAEVYLKLENLQVTGSFKYRGALSALTRSKENALSKVFTASAGNHGLAVAEAAVELGRDVTICIPVTASALKRQRLKDYSVAVIEHGDDCEVTESYAQRMAKEKKAFYISPYNNREVISGQGTVALEMFEQVPSLNKIICSVGGGGLISGVGVVANAVKPKSEVIGVVAANSPAMTSSINQGRIVKVMQEPTIADGIAGNIEPDSITFPMCQELVADWAVVEEEDIKTAIFEFLDNEGMLIEGASAAAIAGILRKQVQIKPKETVGIVICGGNISKQEWREIIVEHLVSKSRK